MSEHPDRGPGDGTWDGTAPRDEPVVRDRRRVRADADTPLPPTVVVPSNPFADPAPAGGMGAPAGAPTPSDGSLPDGGLTDAGLLAEIEAARAAVAERTADLQRVSAEYANYRRRVDRDREAVREQATVALAQSLLGVLDDIDRARQYEELSQGFRSVADSLEQIVGKLGLVRFGEVGDPFDPTRHEALIHGYSADVTEPTCTTVISVGYRMGERIVRPARVGVSEPQPVDAPAPESTGP